MDDKGFAFQKVIGTVKKRKGREKGMQVKDLLKGLEYRVVQGSEDTAITSVAWNSRKVRPGALFICVKGKNVDRHTFAAQAVEGGASVLVAERLLPELPPRVTLIVTPDTRKAMARIASLYYGQPSKALSLIGITGTKGKTSVSWYIAGIFEKAGYKAGVIGTIENRYGSKKARADKINPTTPDALELQSMLREMADEGVNPVAMEVTSIALVNNRVDDCHFEIGVFTNLSQDHLDEHGTMENYKNAKLLLFEKCTQVVANADDPVFHDILKVAGDKKILSFGIKKPADLTAENIEQELNGVRFTLCFPGEKQEVSLKVPGIFSVYNALAAAGACFLRGLSPQAIAEGLCALEGVKGRFEVIPNSKGIQVIIDYAHNPDSLENVLRTIKEMGSGKITVVFGCGGNRDRDKRPIMGKIAGQWADYVIITTDNPRLEDPLDIARDIEQGVKETDCPHEFLLGREWAIKKALERAGTGDTVLIAGKGHETYQVFSDRAIHFDDTRVVKDYFDLF